MCGSVFRLTRPNGEEVAARLLGLVNGDWKVPVPLAWGKQQEVASPMARVKRLGNGVRGSPVGQDGNRAVRRSRIR